jgi:hypothetical protein
MSSQNSGLNSAQAPTTLLENDGCLRYFDGTSGRYYWHNTLTNESRWEEVGEEASIAPVHVSTSALAKKRAAKIGSFADFRSEFQRNPDYFLKPDDSEQWKPLVPKTKAATKKVKSHEIRSNILCYRRFVYLHALVFETPCAIIESSLRASFLFLVSCLCGAVTLFSLITLNGSLFHNSMAFLQSILKEAVISV